MAVVFDRFLTDDELNVVCNTAIQLGLASARDTLLGGLPRAFIAGLQTDPIPAQQLSLDLKHFNTTPFVVRENGAQEIPLEYWLSEAYQLRRVYPQSKVFSDMLTKVRAQKASRATLAINLPPPAEPVVSFPHAAPKPLPSLSPTQATAVVLAIHGLAEMPGPDGVDALTVLHRTLAALGPKLYGCRVLSSITGAILVIPENTLPKHLHDASLLPSWLAALDAAGLSVRCGVAKSLIEWVVDADDTVNAVGRCINIGARLASSNENTGLLYEKSYVDPASGLVRGSHFLYPSNHRPILIEGKRSEVFTCIADPTVKARDANSIPALPDEDPSDVVLIAYDLPNFSEGDLKRLAARFKDVSAEVRSLREQQMIPRNATTAFSPGGDGGVLSIQGIGVDRALSIALDLAGKLIDVTEVRTQDASARARIGVHYGPTYVYANAEGIRRPTGHALFEADALAGDKEARSWDSIVVSGALIERESVRWREIGALTSAFDPNKKIRRFVEKHAPRVQEPVSPKPEAPPPAPTAAAPFTGAAPTYPFTKVELKVALLDAFRSYSALQIMLAEELGKQLNQIVSPGNLEEVVFGLIDKAEAGSWLMDLFEAALRAQPGNYKLRVLDAKRAKRNE